MIPTTIPITCVPNPNKADGEPVECTGTGAVTFIELVDVPQSYAGAASKVVSVKLDETGLEFTPAAGGTTFIGLTDVPGSYMGSSEKVVRVNAAANGLEFFTLDSLLFAAGSVASPALAVGTAGNGIYASALNTLDFVTNGVQRWAMAPDGALESIGSGVINTTVGDLILKQAGVTIFNVYGDNIRVGNDVLSSLTSGENNIGIGTQSLPGLTSGSSNIGVGYFSLRRLTGGQFNIGLGYSAGSFITTGIGNIAIGFFSELDLTSGSYNITLGHGAAVPSITGDNQLCIGNAIYGTGLDGIGSSVSNSRIGINIKDPAARLHLPPGIDSPGYPPFKLSAGTNLSSPESGAVEFDGTNVYCTDSIPVRRTISYVGSPIIASVQSLSGAGAVNITTLTTALTSTGTLDALTLANGTVGQIKTVIHAVDGGSSLLTPTTPLGYSTITFTNAGDSVILQFVTQGWAVVASKGVVIT